MDRVSPLVPYFVCASGLLSLAVEDAGHGTLDSVPIAHPPDHDDGVAVKTAESPPGTMRPGHSDSTLDVEWHRNHEFSGGQHDWCGPRPSHVNMPVVAHARLLLSEMSAVHAVASLAEGMLQRASSRN